MDQSAVDVSFFRLNPKLDVDLLAGVYRGCKHLHIPNFFAAAVADQLYQHLRTEVVWRTFMVANERQFGTPPGPEGVLTPDEDREMLEFAYQGARDGFSSLFDADRPVPGAMDSADAGEDVSVLSGFSEFFNSETTLDLFRSVTGIIGLRRVEVQCTRFRVGHFVTFHCATDSSDKTGKRRISFELSLTPEWRPEWGGLLAFRGSQGHSIESVQPCFNALDVFAFPRGHWISVVSPFAGGPRYAICGHMYIA